MVYQQSAKEEIKNAADIVELIGQFVQLKKAGRNYVGLCPFHSEKEPSFTVSAERQTFHCFGCKKGGDIFSFWMEYHSLTFPEALRDLAERYHVTISEGFSGEKERERAAQRNAIFKINERAASYFQEVLKDPVKGKAAGSYLAGRSVSQEVISEFRLGYAPDEWDGLIRFLRREKLDPDMAARAGLIIAKKNGGYYDRFRGRIIFPIIDLRGQVVGFGGRVLDNSLPKYLNTPETPVFHKGESLYGLHSSHRAVRETGRAVLVEGYMDFIALKKHGFKEVAATLGTALTAEHIRRLKGYAQEVIVVFDSDEAGKTAALKSLPLFSNEGLSAKAVVLPEGHDPDTFVNANGLKRFRELLDRAAPLFDFFIDQKIGKEDLDVEGKVRVLKETLPVLARFSNDSHRSLYARRLSERLEIREEVIRSELRSLEKGRSGTGLQRRMKGRLSESRVEKRFDDLHLLNLLVHYPEVASRLAGCDWRVILSDSAVMEIFEAFFKKYGSEGPFAPEELLESLTSDVAREQFREALVDVAHFSKQEVDLAVAEIEGKAQEKKIAASIKMAKGDIEALNQLLELKRSKDRKVLGG